MTETSDLEPLAEAPPSDETSAAQDGAPDEPEVEIVSFGDDDPESEAPASGDELDELRERYLRLRADFDNFRKRAERDRFERIRQGLADALRELLPVADNLERAIAAPGELDDLRRGVEMIARQLEDVLRRQGIEPVAALGVPFDPQLHDAVAREESDEIDEPTVVEEMQRGYLFGNVLLRPSLVRVAMPATGEPPTGPGDTDPGEEPS